jgi:hypothetical protein
VSKYDAASNEVWTRQFGTSSDDGHYGIGGGPNGVAADASGVYVFGHTFGAFPGQTKAGLFTNAFVAKIQISLPPTVDAGAGLTV